MKGFGQSSRPLEVEKYSLKSLATDLILLLDHLKIPKAVFCGHDHGGSVVRIESTSSFAVTNLTQVWRVGLHFPSRVLGIASICTPYIPPRPEYVPIQEIARIWPSFKYQVYFNSGDPPVREFEGNEERFFLYFFR